MTGDDRWLVAVADGWYSIVVTSDGRWLVVVTDGVGRWWLLVVCDV